MGIDILSASSKKESNMALKPRQLQLIDDSLEIAELEALDAGTLGFMAATLAQVTLPHSKQKDTFYTRTNGNLTLTVRGHPKYGVPYGTVPRVVLAWICTEAVRTKSKTLILGKSVNEFSKKLQMNHCGRDARRLKQQCLALARSIISIDCENKLNNKLAFHDLQIITKGLMFWSDNHPDRENKWDSTITLSDDFYKAITTRPVPFDMRSLQSLSKSPLAMDIYIWLLHRMYVLRISRRKTVLIPWAALKAQFGSSYSDDQRGIRNFKIKFLERLKEVLLFYPEAHNFLEDKGHHLKMVETKLKIKTATGQN